MITTRNTAAVEEQFCKFRSAKEGLRGEKGKAVILQMDCGGVNRDLPGDRGQVASPALYDIHVPGLKLENIYWV